MDFNPVINENRAKHTNDKKEVNDFVKEKHEALGKNFSNILPKKSDQLKKPIYTSCMKIFIT